MTRRARSTPGASFFAFQDIITAVSGVMIVIVLLLAVELMQRPEGEGRPSIAVRNQLVAAIDEAHQQRRRLTEQVAEADRQFRALAAAPPRQLQARIDELEREIEEFKRQIERQRAQSDELTEQEQQVAAERFDAQADEEELQRIQAQIDDLEERIDRLRSSERPLYGLPRGFRGEGWLVVVDAERIEAASLARRQRPIVFESSAGSLDDGPAAPFLRWADLQDSGSSYWLLLVRPDGVDVFDLLEPALRAQRLRYGFDLVAQDETILDPESGAVP